MPDFVADIKVHQFIIDWINSSQPKGPYAIDGTDCNLVEKGFVDSIGFLRLITALEEEFMVEIDFGDLSPEKFTAVSGLTKAVLASLSSTPDES